jgi:hypothetical protein
MLIDLLALLLILCGTACVVAIVASFAEGRQ